MRTVICLLFLCSISLLAQRGGRGGAEPVIPPGPPKNLKILPADVNIQQTMGAFRTAIGVQCNYCHIAGDFSSDDNPKKNMARNMLRIAADINATFPDGQGGKVTHVTCYTCHRGEAKPKMEAPAPGAAAKPAEPKPE